MYHDSIHNERLMAVSGTGGCLTWQYPVFALVAQMLQFISVIYLFIYLLRLYSTSAEGL